MQWEVSGADRETGVEKTIFVEADDEESAKRRGNRRGLMVAWAKLVDVEDSVTAVVAEPAARYEAAVYQPQTIYQPAPDPLEALEQSLQPSLRPPPPSMSVTSPVNIVQHFGGRSGRLPANGLGVAGLVLGIISLLICWLPLIGIASAPVSVLGLILSLVGVLMAVSNRRSGVGFPILGMLVCALSIAAVVYVNLTALHIPQALAARMSSPAQDQWLPCSEPVTLGNVTVRFVSARVGKVPIALGLESGSVSKSDQLMVNISLTNNSASKKVEYSGWAGKIVSFENDSASIVDDAGNKYRRIDFGISRPAGQVDDGTLYPGQTITDVLVFEPPTKSARILKMEAPGKNLEADGTLRWQIPASAVGTN